MSFQLILALCKLFLQGRVPSIVTFFFPASFLSDLEVRWSPIGSSFCRMSGENLQRYSNDQVSLSTMCRWVEREKLPLVFSFSIYTIWMGISYHGFARGSKREPTTKLTELTNCGFTGCVWIKRVIQTCRPSRLSAWLCD